MSLTQAGPEGDRKAGADAGPRPPGGSLETDGPFPFSLLSQGTTSAILVSILVIGLGCFAGFGAFHSAFHHRCLAEAGSNSTLTALHQRLLESVADHNRCLLDEESHVEELHGLRGRLEAQTDLISLLSEHLDGSPKVEELQDRIDQMEDELSASRAHAEIAQMEKMELEGTLESERETSAWMEQRHAEDLSAMEGELQAWREEREELVNYTRQRQGVMIRQLYVFSNYSAAMIVVVDIGLLLAPSW
jgi:hypothetical protein